MISDIIDADSKVKKSPFETAEDMLKKVKEKMDSEAKNNI